MTAALAQMAGVGYRGLNFYIKEGAMLYCGLDLHAKESYICMSSIKKGIGLCPGVYRLRLVFLRSGLVLWYDGS